MVARKARPIWSWATRPSRGEPSRPASRSPPVTRALPSSEVIEKLSEVAGEADIYTEWSVNEKVALEVAAAASFAELRAISVMKQNGVNVAADFILHLVLSGTRGGLVLVSCEDPGYLSSQNEGDSRTFARLNEIPLLEPGDFQEAKDMTKWGLELSEQIGNLVLLRSVTRMSHASGNITFGAVPAERAQARFRHEGAMLDPIEGPMLSLGLRHREVQEKLQEGRRDCSRIRRSTPTKDPKNPSSC